ncbi:MAG TPA: hypothetical protein VEP90_08525, partial [Methylomirabilota bacterium]|nr:hypothetical protein [Methylomirabilota bacterium]
MVKITEQQLTSITRFGRNYAVNFLELTQVEDNIQVRAELRAGRKLIEKKFTLNPNGSLVKEKSNEGSQT